MFALTICQPYATLILEGSKRVENRSWETKYRGRLYIHAGRNRDWLSLELRDGVEFEVHSNRPVERLPFGYVIGIATLVDCVEMAEVERGRYDKTYPWLREHEHANGPWCWVFAEHVTPIGPWRYKGRQGLFQISDRSIDQIANAALGVAAP